MASKKRRKLSYRRLLQNAHPEAGLSVTEQTRRETIRRVVKASLPARLGGQSFGWKDANKLFQNNECGQTRFKEYKRVAILAGGCVKNLNFDRGRKPLISREERAAIAAAAIEANHEGANLALPDVQRKIRAAAGNRGMSKKTERRALQSMQTTYRLTSVVPDANTRNRHDNNFDLRNAIAHAGGFDFVSTNPHTMERMDPRLSFNMDVTGVGDSAGLKKTARRVLHPKDSKRGAKTTKQGRSLQRSVKLVSCGTSAGQFMPQVYPFKVDRCTEPVVAINLKGFAPGNRPVHVLLTSGAVTGPPVLSYVLEHIFAPWAREIIDNVADRLELTEQIALLMLDGDDANLKALEKFHHSPAFATAFDPLGARLVLLSASQSNHEQVSNYTILSCLLLRVRLPYVCTYYNIYSPAHIGRRWEPIFQTLQTRLAMR
jgi:hypothetical protein